MRDLCNQYTPLNQVNCQRRRLFWKLNSCAKEMIFLSLYAVGLSIYNNTGKKRNNLLLFSLFLQHSKAMQHYFYRLQIWNIKLD